MKPIIIIILLILLYGCFKAPNNLQRVKNAGQLTVLIRNIPGVYYEGPFGLIGFDYELIKHFADYLGVKLTLINKANVPDMLLALKNQHADMASGRIIITEKRKALYNFSDPYQYLDQMLVYRSGTRAPKKTQQLDKIALEVVSNSSQEELLSNLKQNLIPDLEWHSNKHASVESLLDLANEKVIDFTIANSNEIMINKYFYPELRSAFSLAKDQETGWAFKKFSNDLSLIKEANKFLADFKKSRQLTILTERYYGHVDQFDYVDTQKFHNRILTRLPRFQYWLKKAAKAQLLDWNLLAAISYQESHWNISAISPTGVKGLMMLTHATAEYIGVNNRLSPYQSIFGGAQYYAKLLKRFPDEVKEPDRSLFALAAYNMGYGHVSDARKLCKKRGLDNTRWANIKQVLPLLQREKWYQQTQYGYARGNEGVSYVQNIRKYYEFLKWKDEKGKIKPIKIKAFDIDVPAL